MSFDYSAARELAEELITEFGAAGTFIKKGAAGGYDEYGDVIADSDDIEIAGTVTPLLSYKTAEIDGSGILTSDSYVYFHSDTAPEIDYTITINGVTYRAIDVTELASIGGVNVYRKIQLRS